VTEKEARQIAAIMCDADGGCLVCAKSLHESFVSAFPEHAAAIEAVYRREFEEDRDE
jgi:hypothetical protein